MISLYYTHTHTSRYVIEHVSRCGPLVSLEWQILNCNTINNLALGNIIFFLKSYCCISYGTIRSNHQFTYFGIRKK